MLVIARRINEVLEIGRRTECLVPLSPHDINILLSLIDGCEYAGTPQMQVLRNQLSTIPVGPISIHIVDVRHTAADPVSRLGISADKSIEVHRAEVADRIASGEVREIKVPA